MSSTHLASAISIINAFCSCPISYLFKIEYALHLTSQHLGHIIWLDYWPLLLLAQPCLDSPFLSGCWLNVIPETSAEPLSAVSFSVSGSVATPSLWSYSALISLIFGSTVHTGKLGVGSGCVEACLAVFQGSCQPHYMRWVHMAPVSHLSNVFCYICPLPLQVGSCNTTVTAKNTLGDYFPLFIG